MKITDLDARNIKGLHHIHIRPTDNTILVTGANGQGKSSLLDAIWLALGGRHAAAANPKAVRDGERTASVRLVLGDDERELIVQRSWVVDDDGETTTKLKVADPDGFGASAKQSTLDALTGNMAFDPVAWLRLSDKEQVSTLLQSVELPFDLDELAVERERVFDERTVVNREVSRLEAAVATLPEPPEGTPDEEVSMQGLLEELRSAQDDEQAVREAHAAAERADYQVKRIRDVITDLEQRLAEAKADLVTAEAAAAEAGDAADSAPMLYVDGDDGQQVLRTELIQAQMASVEEVNANVRDLQRRQAMVAELGAKTRESDALTEAIAGIDKRKRTALAEADMPIDGLGLDEKRVTYQGMPLKQASTAEQLKVSAAVAMAANPVIRIIRIVDGNALDSSNLALLSQMADENEYQLWIELVDETGERGFYIEAGELVGATEEDSDGS